MFGLKAARARGRMVGKPKGTPKETLAKAKSAKVLSDSGEKTVAEIAQNFNMIPLSPF